MSYLLKTIARKLLARSLTTSPVYLQRCQPVKRVPQSLVKLRQLQTHYQCEDGRPIWLKAGIPDRILYSSTIVGCYTGVLMVLGTLYDNAKPASWKTDNNTC